MTKSSHLDWCFRLAYRLAWPIMQVWWLHGRHHGVAMAIWLDDRILAVRHSYKRGLQLPGGGIARGEHHRMTAARELEEEVGVVIPPSQLRLAATIKTVRGVIYLYEARVETMPALTVDRREIIEAAFLPPSVLHAFSQFMVGHLTSVAEASNPA